MQPSEWLKSSSNWQKDSPFGVPSFFSSVVWLDLDQRFLEMFGCSPNSSLITKPTQKVARCLSRSVTDHPAHYQSGLPSVQEEERQANTKKLLWTEWLCTAGSRYLKHWGIQICTNIILKTFRLRDYMLNHTRHLDVFLSVSFYLSFYPRIYMSVNYLSYQLQLIFDRFGGGQVI